MFLRRAEPIPLMEDGLDGLCASLNRPVVDIDDLPVGPARAAIVLHRDEIGQPGLAVVLRSEESGAVTLFQFQGELNADGSQAMEAGLAFAEGMGFLFDEDLLASGTLESRQRALDHWCELTGEELVDPPESLAPMRPIAADDAAFDLDELSDLIDHDLDDELLAPGPQGAAALLSKFREQPESAEPASPSPLPADLPAEDAGGPAEVGRIQVVRRKSEEGSGAPSLLARLLASF